MYFILVGIEEIDIYRYIADAAWAHPIRSIKIVICFNASILFAIKATAAQ